jgi:hypothetical protein
MYARQWHVQRVQPAGALCNFVYACARTSGDGPVQAPKAELAA